jgi:hypothetical protein
MLPVLWDEETAASSRGRVVRYGRFLEGQREHLQREEREEEWVEDLEGHVEVFDRMDGFQMLSMRGPVTFEDNGGQYVPMQFRVGSPQMQLTSAPFSAASRDPLGRFGSLREYLQRGHEEEYPCCLCIRVTLRDMRTGKMALVWEVNNGRVHHLNSHNGVDCYSVRGLQRHPNAIERLVGQTCAYLYMRPVVGQGEGVSMQDRLYRVQPRDLFLSFCPDRRRSVEQFIGALS